MAFNLSYLRDGTWSTRPYEAQTAGFAAPAVDGGDPLNGQEPPSCGILTRTIVESSTAQWILRAQVRSERHNDIVFVGVSVLEPYVEAVHANPDCPPPTLLVLQNLIPSPVGLKSSINVLIWLLHTDLFRATMYKLWDLAQTAKPTKWQANMTSTSEFETPR